MYPYVPKFKTIAFADDALRLDRDFAIHVGNKVQVREDCMTTSTYADNLVSIRLVESSFFNRL